MSIGCKALKAEESLRRLLQSMLKFCECLAMADWKQCVSMVSRGSAIYVAK